MKKTFFQKTVSFIATFAVLINSLGAPLTVIAQEVTPSPTPTETGSPTPEATVSPTDSASPIATPDATIAPTVVPTESPTPTEIASPTPEVTLTPIPTDSALPTVSPTAQPETQNTTNENAQTLAPPSESPSPVVTPVQPEEEGSLTAQVLETDLFSEVLQENPWFKLITDKLDYAPTEAAVITGTGFTAGEAYSLTVSSNDEPSTSTTIEIIADLSGSFTYVYQLDGTYRPNYLVEAKNSEGNTVAIVTFTDSATTTLFPNGQGFYIGWTGDEADIDETGSPDCDDGSDGDDNVATSTTGNRESVLISLSSIPDGSTITSVDVNVSYRNGNDGGADDGTFQTFTRLNGTNLDSGVNLVAIDTTCTSGTQTVDVADTLKSGATTLEVGVLKTATDTSEVWVGTINAVVTYDLGPRPDLTVTKTNNVAGVVNMGGTFVWTLTVTNNGNTPATFNNENILIDQLPTSGATYTPTSNLPVLTSGGVTGAIDCDISSNTLDCDDNSGDATVVIPAGNSFSVDITVTPTVPGTLTNPRNGGDCEADPANVELESNEDNNVCSPNTVTVLSLHDLTVTKTNNVGGVVSFPNTFVWTLTVTNTGSASVTFNNQDILQDNLPNSGATYSNIVVTPTGGITGIIDCTISSDNLDCDDNSGGDPVVIPASASFTVQITVTPTEDGTLANPRTGGSNKCQVDPDGLYIESNENNNNCSDSVNIAPDTGVTNPLLGQACGLDIAMILDNSGSISSSELTQMKSAMTAFTAAFNGTPTHFSVSHFATTATVDQLFTSDITAVNTAINGIPVDGGYTNWEDGLLKGQSTLTNRVDHPDLVIFASDGNPNTVDNGPADNASESQAVAEAVLVANAIKTGGARILALGIGSDLDTPNMQAISGPNVNTGITSDVITSDFATLADDLADYAIQLCGGTVTVNKQVDSDGDNQYEGGNTEANSLGFTWGLDAETPLRDMGTNESSVSSGSHSITENTVPGYTFTGWYPTGQDYSCSNPPNTSYPVDITTSDNVITAITLCNKLSNGTIIVHKDVQGPNGEDVTDNSNSFEASLDGGTGELISDNIPHTYINVPAGNHTITESLIDSDYTLYGISTTAGQVGTPGGLVVNVAGGQTIDVYVTNRQKSGTITVVKDVVNAAGGPVSDTHSFTANLNPGTQSGSFAEGDNAVFTVNPGTYTVTETDDPAYLELGCQDNLGKSAIVIASGGQGSVTCTNQQNTGTISGYKYEDLDGILGGDQNPVFDWLIELYKWITDDWSFLTSTNTDVNGFYSLSDLLPGLYQVREGTVLGWTNLSPLIISETLTAGEESTENNFVNTQYGSITVYKNVDFNGDGDLDDAEIDAIQAPGWTWDIDGSGNYSANTGENTVGNILPGTYTVSEDQKAGYHITSLVCGDTNYGAVESQEITLSSNQDLVCTFTNTLDTGSVKVNKRTDDNGDGDFNDSGEDLNGTASTAFIWSLDTVGTNAMGSTVAGVTTGNHDVNENSVAGYHFVGWFPTSNTQYTCLNPQFATLPATLAVTTGQSAEVTLCNQKDTGTITIVKDAINNNSQNFTFSTTGGTLPAFFLLDDDSNGTLPNNRTFTVPTGQYTVTEASVSGWKLTNLVCSDENGILNLDDRQALVNVETGEQITCTFTNTKLGSIEGVKYNDQDGDANRDLFEPRLNGWTIFIDTDLDGVLDDGEPTDTTSGTVLFFFPAGEYEFNNLLPGSYSVCEQLQTGWSNSTPLCQTVNVSPGENEDDIDFGNHQALTIKAYKIVCENESDLPNWGDGGAPNITSSTAQNFVNNSDGNCHLETDWDFQYGFDGQVSKEAGDFIGPAGGNWQALGTTNGDGYAETTINSLNGADGIWVRENLQSNYVPFSYPPAGPTENNFSAEIYCHQDGDHYDNFDQIDNARFGHTYYCVAFNALNTGDLEVTKYNDLDGDGFQDPGEPGLAGWEINVGEGEDEQNQATGADGVATFNDLVVGSYELSETLQEGWIQTNISCQVGEGEQAGQVEENNEYYAQVEAGQTTHCKIGNQLIIHNLDIEKTNDKSGGANAGNIINYTLTVTNNGNQTILGVDIIDALPGGFSYVLGSTTGATTADPSIAGGTLTWENVGNLGPENSITIQYQVTIASDISNGTYTNFATCKGEFERGRQILSLLLTDELVDNQTEQVDCDIADSSVPVGQGQNYGGNLQGQVLGASTELPATGSPTILLIISLSALGFGLFLNGFNTKKSKKHAKN